MKIKFPKNNKLRYSQDFSVGIGIPSGVEFEVEFLDDKKEKAKLIAYGYGFSGGKNGKAYGNGAIYISKGDINYKEQ